MLAGQGGLRVVRGAEEEARRWDVVGLAPLRAIRRPQIVLHPHLAQHTDRRQMAQRFRCLRGKDPLHQEEPVRPHAAAEGFSLCLFLWQSLIEGAAGVLRCPLRPGVLAQPIRRGHGQTVEGEAQRLQDQFHSVEKTY